MEEITNLSLEKTLNDFKFLKQNFEKLYYENNVRFCGIKAIDKKIVGFDKDKTYYFVSNEGMGAMTFINSIFENFSLLYDENYSKEKSLGYTEDFQNGDRMLNNVGSKFQYFELSLDITVRDNHEKRPTLNDIPEHIQIKSDVIIALYRPEYYKIDTWEDGTSTENQIEFTILKNHKQILGSDKLYFDKENKKISSIKNPILSKNWTNRMIDLLQEETN